MIEREALEFLRDELPPPVVHPDAEPTGMYLVRTGNTYERFEAHPPHRKYRAESVEGLAALAVLLARPDHDTRSVDDDGNDNARVEVFIGAACAVAVAREAEKRRDTATLPLTRSTPFALLEQGGIREADHAAFVIALLTTFRDMIEDAAFLPLIRDLKFRTDDQGHSRVAQAGGSMGRAVELEATGRNGGTIPETVRVRVPVFAAVPHPANPFRTVIDCALVVNVAARKFSLLPLPGEVERAAALARAEVAAQLAHALETGGASQTIRIHPDAEFIV